MSDDQTVAKYGPEMVALRKLAYWGVDDGVDADEVPLPDAVDETLDRLEQLEQQLEEHSAVVQTLEEINSDHGSKERKYAQIVSYADRVRDRAVVTVRPREIKGAVDVSQRYAYSLVDDMAAEFEWAWNPADETRRPEMETPEKALRIDFEQLQTDGAALNLFNNVLEADTITA